MARPSPKKPAPRAAKKPAPVVSPEPPPEEQLEQGLPDEPEREPTPAEARARDQGTLRFFSVLLAATELTALAWAIKTHASRNEYLAVAGALLVLFGLPMFFAWRSLSMAAATPADSSEDA